jgi:hypothetical protein
MPAACHAPPTTRCRVAPARFLGLAARIPAMCPHPWPHVCRGCVHHDVRVSSLRPPRQTASGEKPGGRLVPPVRVCRGCVHHDVRVSSLRPPRQTADRGGAPRPGSGSPAAGVLSPASCPAPGEPKPGRARVNSKAFRLVSSPPARNGRRPAPGAAAASPRVAAAPGLSPGRHRLPLSAGPPHCPPGPLPRLAAAPATTWLSRGPAVPATAAWPGGEQRVTRPPP